MRQSAPRDPNPRILIKACLRSVAFVVVIAMARHPGAQQSFFVRAHRVTLAAITISHFFSRKNCSLVTDSHPAGVFKLIGRYKRGNLAS